jgi:hypothetical protein
MQNFCFGFECFASGYRRCEGLIHSIGPKMMFRSVLVHFDNLRHVKVAKLMFEPECTSVRYQSCEASILVH